MPARASPSGSAVPYHFSISITGGFAFGQKYGFMLYIYMWLNYKYFIQDKQKGERSTQIHYYVNHTPTEDNKPQLKKGFFRCMC